jgi:ATP-dependent helicase/nuclease subunit B
MPGSISRHFLGWKLPLVQTVGDWLISDWSGTKVLDLSDRLLVLPSRTAGRRLREALAIRAAQAGQAVFPPKVVTPDFLISPTRLEGGTPASPVASAAQERMVWTALLQRIRLSDFRRLFPVDPVERSLRWADETAGGLLEVRRLLIEAGHSIASAGKEMARAGLESGRWADLTLLEDGAMRLFEETALRDPGFVQLNLSQKILVPEGIRHIVVAGVADLRALAEMVLLRLAGDVPVDLLVGAPQAEAVSFDPWGRPLVSGWLRREIPFPATSTSIHRLESPRAQARWVADRCLRWAGQMEGSSRNGLSSILAVGIPDAEVGPEVAQSCRQVGIGIYDPAGERLASAGLAYLLECAGEALVSGSFAAFRRFLICPGVARAVLRYGLKPGEVGFSESSLLCDADSLDKDCMPATVADALQASSRLGESSALSRGLRWLQFWQDRFRKGEFVSSLVELLGELHEGRTFAKRDPEGQILAAVVGVIMELEEDFHLLAGIWPISLSLADHFDLLRRRLCGEVLYPEHDAGDVELCGWLELLWEDSPRLIVTGLNDHAVPESTLSHAYLPDSARKILGIPHNEDRFARDAYFLTSVIESRQGGGGRVELLFGSHSLSGNPLRPSRLLFQCPLEVLPQQTQRLFQGDSEVEISPARKQGFRLLPEALPGDHKARTQLSASAMRTYLLCPFRYYLKHGRKMESLSVSQGEMESRDFGTIMHDTLEAFAAAPEAISTVALEITAFYHAELDRRIERRYGSRLPVPLMIQRESARNRLRWWADIEAAERSAGWRIRDSEVAFGTDDWPFQIDGMPVRGRIDRIEEHPELGLRVIDFKTGNGYKAKKHVAADSHLTALKRNESPKDFEAWSLFEDEAGKVKRWTDLQLPLYLMAVGPLHPGRPLTAAYVTLGQTQPEVALEPWEELGGELLESARICAAGIVHAVRSGVFWPAKDLNVPWDDFKEMFVPDAASAVDPRLLLGAKPV